MIKETNQTTKRSIRGYDFSPCQSLFIQYRGAIVIRRELNEPSPGKDRHMDFWIPRNEYGTVQFTRVNKVIVPSQSDAWLIESSTVEIMNGSFSKTIQIGSMIFIDAMLFLEDGDRLFRLRKKSGMMQIQVHSDEKRLIYGRLNSISNG